MENGFQQNAFQQDAFQEGKKKIAPSYFLHHAPPRKGMARDLNGRDVWVEAGEVEAVGGSGVRGAGRGIRPARASSGSIRAQFGVRIPIAGLERKIDRGIAIASCGCSAILAGRGTALGFGLPQARVDNSRDEEEIFLSILAAI